ncbi:MAG TPA: hypothetical protein VMT53_23535 [Terriglobales bacterium]|nr:hypothetical protein [Terriglobales bacterium]
MLRRMIVAAVALGLLVLEGTAAAQVVNSGAATIALNANLSESVSVNLSANAVNFTLAAGSANNPGSSSVTATTAWTLKPSRGNLNIYAFFTSSAAALTDGSGNNIPSSSFQISDNGGAFTALTSTTPFGGANAGLQLGSVRILGNNKQGTRTDTLNFNINLAPLPNLPAGTYTGTVTIQVQVI